MDGINAQAKKFHTCPLCQGRGILLVDVETDSIPQVDDAGNLQYHCLDCQHNFSVEQNGVVPTLDERSET